MSPGDTFDEPTPIPGTYTGFRHLWVGVFTRGQTYLLTNINAARNECDVVGDDGKTYGGVSLNNFWRRPVSAAPALPETPAEAVAQIFSGEGPV